MCIRDSANEAGKILAMRGPEMGGSMLRQLLDAAINGVGKVPGAKATAAQALVREGSVEPAIDSLVSTHVRLATAQGVITNLGGLWTAPLLLPANIASLGAVEIDRVDYLRLLEEALELPTPDWGSAHA